MNFTSWQMSDQEMASWGTAHAHAMLRYLAQEKIITEEQSEELQAKLMVVAVRNEEHYGKKILRQLFSIEAKPSAYSFPIAEVKDV